MSEAAPRQAPVHDRADALAELVTALHPAAVVFAIRLAVA
jgi:hypothetical protein